MMPQADPLYLTNFVSVRSVILYPKTFLLTQDKTVASKYFNKSTHTHNEKGKNKEEKNVII